MAFLMAGNMIKFNFTRFVQSHANKVKFSGQTRKPETHEIIKYYENQDI